MKARHVITNVLIAVYLTAITGIAFNMHFCGGKLDSVSLFKSETGCAMCANTPDIEKETGCCKDTQVEVKVKDDHQQVAKIALEKVAEFVRLCTTEFPPFLIPATSFDQKYAFNKAPPDGNFPSKNVLYCNFRI